MKNAVINAAILFSLFLLGSLIDGFLAGARLMGGVDGDPAGAGVLATLVGFCVVGCRMTLAHRVRHLCWQGVFFYAVNTLYCLYAGPSEDSFADFSWFAEVFLGNLFFTVLCAGVGGVLSMAIMSSSDKRLARQEP